MPAFFMVAAIPALRQITDVPLIRQGNFHRVARGVRKAPRALLPDDQMDWTHQ
jgi:hypothetical protein